MNWLRNIFKPRPPESNHDDASSLRSEYLEQEKKIAEAGEVEGAYYTDYVEKVKQLKREGRHQEAIDLLFKLIDATEAEAKEAGGGWGVAPWYYEQLAIIYRKEQRFSDEVQILERYAEQQKAPGVGPSKLGERLKKARVIASNKGVKVE